VKLKAVCDAENLLKTRGWGQGALAYMEDGSEVEKLAFLDTSCKNFCLYGSLHAVTRPDIVHNICEDLCEMMDKDSRDVETDIADWNDDKGRTVQDVVTLLHKYKNEYFK